MLELSIGAMLGFSVAEIWHYFELKKLQARIEIMADNNGALRDVVKSMKASLEQRETASV